MNTVTIEQIVKYLDDLAGDIDMASVHINCDGECTLRVGLTYKDTISVEQLKERINVSPAM
jgi:hypothetical protein